MTRRHREFHTTDIKLLGSYFSSTFIYMFIQGRIWAKILGGSKRPFLKIKGVVVQRYLEK